MGYTFGEKKIIYVKNVTVLGELTALVRGDLRVGHKWEVLMRVPSKACNSDDRR